MNAYWFMRIWLTAMAALLGGLAACFINMALGLMYEGFFIFIPLMLAAGGVTYWWFGKRFHED